MSAAALLVLLLSPRSRLLSAELKRAQPFSLSINISLPLHLFLPESVLLLGLLLVSNFLDEHLPHQLREHFRQILVGLRAAADRTDEASFFREGVQVLLHLVVLELLSFR